MRTTVTSISHRRFPALPRSLACALTLASAALLSGCASDKPASNTIFDFGSTSALTTNAAATTVAAIPKLAAVVIMDVTGPAALDSERMVYRLNYADPLQARTYANSRWSATPLQLVTERLRSRVAQSGTKVLAPTDAANGIAILRVEIDAFSHDFDSVSQSQGQLVLRASLFQGHQLIDQKTFARQTSAASADAAGGARALAASTDAAAADIVAWLASLPLPASTVAASGAPGSASR